MKSWNFKYLLLMLSYIYLFLQQQQQIRDHFNPKNPGEQGCAGSRIPDSRIPEGFSGNPGPDRIPEFLSGNPGFAAD